MTKFLFLASVFFAAYLIVSLPAVYATTVNIRYQGVSHSSQQIDAESLVSRSVILHKNEPFYTNMELEMSLYNASQKGIEKIYIFKCRSKDPIACSELVPDVFQGNVAGKRYAWSEVSEKVGPGLFDEVANIMYIVKLNSKSGEDIWVGLWDSIRRTGQTTFSDPPYGSSIGSIDLERTATAQTSVIEKFIQENSMLPFNPSWTQRAEFTGAESLHQVRSTRAEIDMPAFSSDINPSNIVTGIEKDYYFVFPKTGNGFANPVTLNRNPSYVCGNNVKEPSLGETEQNCCYDFGCSQQGFYCDTHASACRQENKISLEYRDRPSPRVTNCNIFSNVNVTVRVNNPPGGLSIVSREENIAGYVSQVSCTGGPETGHLYTCELVVPPQQDCGSGEVSIGPNSVSFSISFDNGPQRLTKKISTSIPDITVGSFVSGDGICESGLGEKEVNSCYDCGCFGGYYCDYVQPGSGTCRPDLRDSDLVISNVAPVNFPFYNAQAGDSFMLAATINNRPESLSLIGASCSMGCTSESACSARCFATCSGSSGDYACRIEFLIENYTQLQSYRLSPTLNLFVIYNNGTSKVSKSLSSAFNFITIGQNYAGDGVCGPTENSVNDCFDCGCDAGYYCDTRYATGPTEGDSCRRVDGVELNMDSISSTQFIDTSIEHEITTIFSMPEKPASLAIDPSCFIGGMDCNDLGFEIACMEGVGTGAEYRAECRIKIPEISYRTSGYYNTEMKKLIFTQNSINVSVSFNNASNRVQKGFLFAIPDITIDVVPVCGNRILEPELGENKDTCCIDAGCGDPGLFCYTGAGSNGACISADSVQLAIDMIDPEIIECEIYFRAEKCSHVREVRIDAHVNLPPNDMNIESPVFFMLDGKQYPVLNCVQIRENVSCYIQVPDFGRTQQGMEEKTLGLTVPISFTANSTRIVRNLTASSLIEIKYSESKALKIMEQDLRLINRQIGKVSTYKNIVLGIVVAGAAACTAICIFASAGCELCWRVWACMSGIALTYVSVVLQKLNELKAQKEALHNSIRGGDYRGASSAATDSSQDIIALVGIAAGAYCAVSGFLGSGGNGDELVQKAGVSAIDKSLGTSYPASVSPGP